MAYVLANQNHKVKYFATLVLDTGYKIIGADEAEVTVAAANGTGADLQDAIQADGFQLGATGETTVNDASLGQIGTEQAITGAAQYAGNFNWYTDDQSSSTNPRWLYRRGVTGFLLSRIGPAATTSFANGDLCHLYQVTFGVQRNNNPAGGGRFTYTQTVNVNKAWELTEVVTTLTA